MMSKIEENAEFLVIILISFVIGLFILTLKLAIFSSELSQLSDNFKIISIDNSKDDNCLFTVKNNTFNYYIQDKCNKYKIGDKLIITKEIK